MGMAASQGRLLFMTARISNNEFEQQCVAYSKQRLADDSQEANDRYLEALQATQYQILTGYNGDTATYEPVTYNQLTALNSVAASKQYIVSDNKGQILVTKTIADAFGDAHTDFNTFLKNVSGGSLTQVSEQNVTEKEVHEAWDKYFTSINRGDKDGIYYDANSKISGKHVLGFSFHESESENGTKVIYATYNTAEITGSGGNIIYLQEDSTKDDTPYFYYVNNEVEVESYLDEAGTTKYVAKYKPNKNIYTGNATYNMMDNDEYVYLNNKIDVELGADGNYIYYQLSDGKRTNNTFSTDENGKIYVSQNYGNDLSRPPIVDDQKTEYVPANEITYESPVIFYEGSTPEQRELYDYAMAITEKYAKGSELEYDADKVQYYKNIYQQMITKGYTTFDKMLDEKYINTMSYKTATGETSSLDTEKMAYCNDNWLITMLKNGKLSIAFYDSNDKNFVKTTLDDDESIVEKENKSKMAIAEQVYQSHMDKIQHEDKRFDMQLTKLESEHTALTTEYESVAKVISKNVEKTFNIFNA